MDKIHGQISQAIKPKIKIPVQSKSLHAVQTKSSSGGSQEGPQYSDFEKAIQKRFGIIDIIGGLLSQTSGPISPSAQEFDEPNH